MLHWLLQPIILLPNSLPYSGNDSPFLTLTIRPTFYLASNGVTIKCSGCSAGDTGMVSGTLYTAVVNGNLTNGIQKTC